ncbi:MAG TPA: hypothetical protein VFA03_10605 [Acetobacteraceae bacterium]|nr:hypothetical protein [Acetobacteraceae bacterium]
MDRDAFRACAEAPERRFARIDVRSASSERSDSRGGEGVTVAAGLLRLDPPGIALDSDMIHRQADLS